MDEYLSKDEKIFLLKLARNTIMSSLHNDPLPELPKSTLSEKLLIKGAAFVTLHMRGHLRGCIGNIIATESLVYSVRNNALAAAFKDPRFEPVSIKEMEYIDIEISALTPPEEIDDVEDFEVGKHGIIMQRGFNQAVFLPQVAPEQGWDKETTLLHLSMKAGLPADGWRDPDVKFRVFQAVVFGEKDE